MAAVRTTLMRFIAAREGVTAIEFAMVAPVLLLLVMGIIEFSLIMLASNVLESATNISSRLSKTGFAETGVTREQTIINSVKSQAGALLDSTKTYHQFKILPAIRPDQRPRAMDRQ